MIITAIQGLDNYFIYLFHRASPYAFINRSFRAGSEMTGGERCILYCVSASREYPIFCPPPSPNGELNTGAKNR